MRNPRGLEGVRRRTVGPDVSLTISISASDLFRGGIRLFSTLEELRAALASDEGEKVRKLTGEPDGAANRVVTAMAPVGSAIERTQSILDRTHEDELSYEVGRSRAEDLPAARPWSTPRSGPRGTRPSRAERASST